MNPNDPPAVARPINNTMEAARQATRVAIRVWNARAAFFRAEAAVENPGLANHPPPAAANAPQGANAAPANPPQGANLVGNDLFTKLEWELLDTVIQLATGEITSEALAEERAAQLQLDVSRMLFRALAEGRAPPLAANNQQGLEPAVQDEQPVDPEYYIANDHRVHRGGHDRFYRPVNDDPYRHRRNAIHAFHGVDDRADHRAGNWQGLQPADREYNPANDRRAYNGQAQHMAARRAGYYPYRRVDNPHRRNATPAHRRVVDRDDDHGDYIEGDHAQHRRPFNR
ncbi:hypothetical protein Q8F55_005039 [Vanrija albida]|uniref:Uncharacterized protein n=1 Tax=Vanrija albida TaxID=181172 RepID=A0ABR3Q0I5_9TREE